MFLYLAQQKSRQYDTLSFVSCCVLPREDLSETKTALNNYITRNLCLEK